MRVHAALVVAVGCWSLPAAAGTITAQGNVVALDNINQMLSIDGTANFDGTPGTQVPLDAYDAEGLNFFTGPLTNILAGVTTAGSASQAQYSVNDPNRYPNPMGGATHDNEHNFFAGVGKFNDTVTQVGLLASNNGTQFLTAWDDNGDIIGQVTWVPASTSGFVGIDTLGVPIGMIAYGNDDLSRSPCSRPLWRPRRSRSRRSP